MTKEQILELCSSIKRLNAMEEEKGPFHKDVLELNYRVQELWEVYCGEKV